MNAFLAGLYVARKKFSLLIDLLYDALENRIGKRIDANFRPLANLDAAVFRFWNVNANIRLIFLKKRGDRRVRSNQVARPDIEHFDNRRGRRDDLALAESRLVHGVGGFRLVDVFAPVAVLHLLEGGLCLKKTPLGRSDFFRPVAALHSSYLCWFISFCARAI